MNFVSKVLFTEKFICLPLWIHTWYQMQSNIKINEGYSSPEIKIGETIIQN